MMSKHTNNEDPRAEVWESAIFLLLLVRDLHELGLRGRLPTFIENFLNGRSFRVRVGTTLSDVFNQEQSVPQGS